jgi:hypothetical protein
MTHILRDIIKVSRYISIDIRPVPSDNAGFLAVKPRPAVGQDFHTAVPGLAEQSLSSRRNLVRISAFHLPWADPDGYCERQVWGMKSGSRRQG